MTQTLAEYIDARNAATLAWIAEDPANRWAGLCPEPAHWAEMGITTVAQFVRNEMESTIWDLYKDVTGCRPHGIDFKSMSDEDLNKEYDYLLSRLESARADEEAYLEHIEEEAAREAAQREMDAAEAPEPIDYVACKYQEGWL